MVLACVGAALAIERLAARRATAARQAQSGAKVCFADASHAGVVVPCLKKKNLFLVSRRRVERALSENSVGSRGSVVLAFQIHALHTLNLAVCWLGPILLVVSSPRRPAVRHTASVHREPQLEFLTPRALSRARARERGRRVSFPPQMRLLSLLQSHAAGLLWSTVVFMKLVSYAHTNSELRRACALLPVADENEPVRVDENEYPYNVRLRDLVLFQQFPTLVYQTSFPRTAKVRKRWVLKRLLELAMVVTLAAFIMTQFMVPTVLESLAPVEHHDALGILEKVLVLAMPSLALWCLMFVGLFELWLSIIAEVTRFGDRLFYKDWWNARKFDEYWRLWNLPVHNWLVRHVFSPVLSYRVGQRTIEKK